MAYHIHTGDSAKILKHIDSDTIDAVVTDPPYGIEFLDKEWDRNTGAVEIWRQCLRILKPGGHLLAFSAARTYHHLATNIESVGFEIRDQLMWLYASGFPKAQQIKGHPGWKTALKPAHEPICMARKPFKGSAYANMATHGVGAVNIDATRIPTDDIRSGGANGVSRLTFGQGETSNTDSFRQYTPNKQGRFPSNVIGEVPGYQKFFYCPKVTRKERNIGCDDPGPQFQVPHGFDYRMPSKHNADPTALVEQVEKTAPATSNTHPTVKPVALMKYLVRLVAPQQAHIVDPFAGSGSTGMACKQLGVEFTGIEQDAGYSEIARRRIAATKTDPKEQLFE